MARPSDPTSERSIAASLTELMGETFTRARIREMKKAGVDFGDIDDVRKYVRNLQRDRTAESKPKPKTKTAIQTGTETPDQEIAAEDIDGQIAELKGNLLAALEKRDAETIDIKIRGLSRIQGMLREQGKYILATDAETDGMKAGLAAKHMWEQIEDALPPMLEGLSALQMKIKLREFAAARIVELHELFSE